MTTIWVDADACPDDIKQVVIRAAERTQTMAMFVANKAVRLPRSPFLRPILVDKGPDVADGRIAHDAAAGDIVVTADIPLAAILVAKGIAAIDPRGDIHTTASIGERLSIRDFMDGLRGSGVVTGGPRPFDRSSVHRFASSFDALLARARKGTGQRTPGDREN
jgi:uncharacterized protein YaiI (UPF0178 family)